VTDSIAAWFEDGGRSGVGLSCIALSGTGSGGGGGNGAGPRIAAGDGFDCALAARCLCDDGVRAGAGIGDGMGECVRRFASISRGLPVMRGTIGESGSARGSDDAGGRVSIITPLSRALRMGAFGFGSCEGVSPVGVGAALFEDDDDGEGEGAGAGSAP
jgi:hypothetical protein